MAKILFVGTYTTRQPHVDGKGLGLERFRVVQQNDDFRLEHVGKPPVAVGKSPTYLALSASQKLLFACKEELDDGGLTVLSIDADSHDVNLTPVAHRKCGHGSCHVCVSRSGEIVVVSNYHEGSVNVFRLVDSHDLVELQYIKYAGGSGVVADRQGSAHAHGCILDPTEEFAYIADLGNDCLWRYSFDAHKGLLVESERRIPLPPGSGPRSTAFHPSGQLLYVTCELSCKLVAVRISDLTVTQEISTLSCGRQLFHSNADLQVSPDGRHLYVGVRGDPADTTSDYITIFRLNNDDGQLTKVGHQPTGGKIPRHFTLDPTGDWLLVGNQDSDTIVVFRRCPDSGLLTQSSGRAVPCPTPVFLQLYQS